MAYYLLQYNFGGVGWSGASGPRYQTIMRTHGNRYIVIGDLVNGKREHQTRSHKWSYFIDRDIKLIMYPELHKYYSNLEFNRITKEEAFEILL